MGSRPLRRTGDTRVVRTPPPDLPDAALTRALLEHWGIRADTVDHRPVGFGSHHWAVVAGRARWFLTIDDLDVRRRTRSDTRAGVRARLAAALSTARELADGGLGFVVAPIPTAVGDLLVDVGDHFAAALYPHIVGRSREGDDGYRTTAERRTVLDLIIDLHQSASRHARVDDLSIGMLDGLQLAVGELGRPWTAGPYSERCRRLLDERAAPLLRLVDAYRVIAGEVLAAPDRFVLTHGEPHPGNTLVTDRGLVLIDWDTVLIAPPERDLWSLAGNDRQLLDAYTAATGTGVQEAAMVCYAVRWDLDEIAGYVTLLRHPHADSADVAESWRNLQHFLQPESRWPRLCSPRQPSGTTTPSVAGSSGDGLDPR